MKITKLIKKIALPLLAVTFISGCSDTQVKTNVANVNGNKNTVNFEGTGAFYDVDKDGKEDLINAIYLHLSGNFTPNSCYFFWRKNLGGGNFEKKARFWYKDSNAQMNPYYTYNNNIPTIDVRQDDEEKYSKYKNLLDSLDKIDEVF